VARLAPSFLWSPGKRSSDILLTCEGKNDMPTVAERLLKVGIKATVPVVGDLVAAALEEGGGYFLDQRAERQAKDLYSRLLSGLNAGLKEAETSGEIDPGQLDYLMPTIEELLATHPIRQDEWASLNFNIDAATTQILSAAPRLMVGLSEQDLAVLRVALASFYQALHHDRDAVLQFEPEFRRAVLDRIDALPEVIAQASEQREVATALAALVSIPWRAWRPDRSPPGALLRADFGIVPFHGRNREIVDVAAWCEAPLQVGVALWTGPGGMGKSRLFIEACRVMQSRTLGSKTWRAGFLAPEAKKIDAAAWSHILRIAAPVLIVVDYAETRRDELRSLLRQAAAASEGPVRIVLLARAADDWWEALKSEGDGVGDLLTGPATRRTYLQPLAMDSDARLKSYELAAEKFASTLGKPIPVGTPSDLDASHFRIVLLLHMAALAAVEGVQVKGDQGILDWMLNRERGFWARLAEARGLPTNTVEAILEALALATLEGGVSSRSEAVDLLGRLGLLQDQPALVRDAIAGLLHETYPGEKWIEPMLPDLLGEHLVQVATDRNPNILDAAFGHPPGGREPASA
jgi:hypothetical protein